MNTINDRINYFHNFFNSNVTIIVVSKGQSISRIEEVYSTGHRDFGESYVKEMLFKYNNLNKNIRWHMLGNLQTNKIKFLVPFVYLIHSIDSFYKLKIVNKEAKKNMVLVKCLLQIKISKEINKSGIISLLEINKILNLINFHKLKNIKIIGLMGIASHTNNEIILYNEFNFLKKIFYKFKLNFPSFKVISMGMSNDYKIAFACGSNMVRIGKAIFS